MVINMKNFTLSVLLLLLMFSCAKMPEKTKIFFDSLPVLEASNASLYNYEKLSQRAETAFRNNSNTALFEIFQEYYESFENSDEDGKVRVFLEMYMQRAAELESHARFISNMPASLRENLSLSMTEGTPEYSGKALLELLVEIRSDYHFEKRLLNEYSESLWHVEEENRLALFQFLAPRYPDSKALLKMLQKSEFIDLTKLSRKDKKKYMTALVEIESHQSNQTLSLLAEVKGSGALARSRMHEVKSRLVDRLYPGEVVTVLASNHFEAKDWYYIRYRGSNTAYVPFESVRVIPQKETADYTLSHSLQKLWSLYGKGQYLALVKKIADYYFNSRRIKEQKNALLLSFLAHKAIAQRVSARESEYGLYASRYYGFFSVSDDGISLLVSDWFLSEMQLIDKNNELIFHMGAH